MLQRVVYSLAEFFLHHQQLRRREVELLLLEHFHRLLRSGEPRLHVFIPAHHTKQKSGQPFWQRVFPCSFTHSIQISHVTEVASVLFHTFGQY